MQPCNTCMYSCREGYCGIGSKPYDNYCGDRVVGDRAPVPPQAPLAWLMQVSPYYWDPRPQVPPWVTTLRQLPLTDQLPGLPYIVKGVEGRPIGPIRCGNLRVRYVVVLPQHSYRALCDYQRSIGRSDTPFRFVYQRHELHIHQTPGLPVIVAVAYEQTAPDPHYVPNWLLRWDIGQYLWWTGWEVDTWRVEAFLEGLVALHTAHLRSEVAYSPPSRVREPQGPPPRIEIHTRVVPSEEVYERLLGMYMTDIRNIFKIASQSEVHDYLERWRWVLWYHSYPEDRYGRR